MLVDDVVSWLDLSLSPNIWANLAKPWDLWMNELNPRLNSWVWMINMAFCWGDLSYVLLLRLIWKSLFGWRLGAQWRSKDVMLRIAWPAKINFTNVCLSIESSIERRWVLEPVETYLVSSCWRSNVYYLYGVCISGESVSGDSECLLSVWSLILEPLRYFTS